MPSYVLRPDAAIRLAELRGRIPEDVKLLAPTVVRSHVLAALYRSVRSGTLTRREADERLTYIRSIRIRLLGDRVLQQTAWKLAEQLAWPDTIDAEYVALAQLHGDALITQDESFARTVQHVVSVESVEVLTFSG